MKIMIGINTLNTIDQVVYANHFQLAYRLGRHCKDIDFALNAPPRMSIDRMRNLTAKIALENDFDYVLFIDDDVIVPLDFLPRMLKADADIIAGWTIIRGYPFENMFFRFNSDKSRLDYVKNSEIQPDENALIDVDAVGFSLCLIKTSLMRKIPTPYFVTGPYNTEDIYFCMKAKDFVPEVSIKVDTSLLTHHRVGSEFISPENYKAYKRYLEELDPNLTKPQSDRVDRGEEYLKQVKSIYENA